MLSAAAGQPVLHRTTLKVGSGEHVALVGRTGAGKTSALQLLAGLYVPWAGTVRIAGRDPAVLAETERRKLLGVVPQVVQLRQAARLMRVLFSEFRAGENRRSSWLLRPPARS